MKQIADDHRSPVLHEHSDRVLAAVKSNQIVMRGEVPYTNENKTAETTEVAMINYPKEIFYIYHGKDERDPFHFIK